MSSNVSDINLTTVQTDSASTTSASPSGATASGSSLPPSLTDRGSHPNVAATVGRGSTQNSDPTNQQANGASVPSTGGMPKRGGIFERLKTSRNRPLGHSILHQIGLKILTFKDRYKGAKGEEVPKPMVEKSFRIALASLSIHLLPTCITIFLVSFNVYTFVNGPPVSVTSQYVLQGASKLHELTIVASLARVISDILRYQLLHDGVKFGMLSSPFSFLGLNYLWSQEFFSALRPLRPLRRIRSKAHIFLLVVLVAFCLLAAVVGPASALLFVPSAAWLSSGSTDYYIIGTEEQLWPQHLTERHAGPQQCDVGDGGNFWCPQGGWDIIQGFVTPTGVARRLVNLDDARTPRTLWLHRNSPGDYGTDSWASTSHGASVYIAARMEQDHTHAWGFAKGRMPVVRVVCAPVRQVNRTSPTLLFPVLDSDRPWRKGDDPGPFRELRLEGIYESLVNVSVHVLPTDFGVSTAGIAFVTNNKTTAVGCGCSFDARWAHGWSSLNMYTSYWSAFIGRPKLPTDLMFASPQTNSFFAPELKDHFGPPITADMGWLRHLSTGFQLMDSTGNFTALEVILVSTRLWDLPWTLNDPVNPIMELEAVLSVYFVNALSRLGWDPQRDPFLDQINPILHVGDRDTDALLHDSGQIYERPMNVTTQPLRQEWFVYATAWQLSDSTLYISVAILGAHFIVVVLHSIAVLCTRQSSEALSSVSEIVALAYLSKPASTAFENCGAGIMLQKTLRQRVRVEAIEENGEHNVRLMSCDVLQKRSSDGIVKVDHKYG
ncbi:hypothetical protein FB567DRAFT_588628 [Paraphoma chrysanthemicola]|uniref:Transmembrane protein n=1 Tax=Paraphoma chrysanthemicola TaxID=798071 RepID=A0A8K0REI4_9PLEO|nr:hypothetical protein FB567DRAFT_588628 [Paraphoma chrysanthemicola]